MFNSVYIQQDKIGLGKFLYDKGFIIKDSNTQDNIIRIYCGDILPSESFHIWIKNSTEKWSEEFKKVTEYMRFSGILFVIISNVKDDLCGFYDIIVSKNGIVHKFANQYELWSFLPIIMDSIHG